MIFRSQRKGTRTISEKNCLSHVAVYISLLASGHGTWRQQAFVEYPCQSSSSRGPSEFNGSRDTNNSGNRLSVC